MDAALREQCGVEVVWPEFVTEPIKASLESFKILVGEPGDLFILRALETSLMSNFGAMLNLPPTGVAGLSSVLPCPLCLGASL